MRVFLKNRDTFTKVTFEKDDKTEDIIFNVLVRTQEPIDWSAIQKRGDPFDVVYLESVEERVMPIDHSEKAENPYRIETKKSWFILMGCVIKELKKDLKHEGIGELYTEVKLTASRNVPVERLEDVFR